MGSSRFFVQNASKIRRKYRLVIIVFPKTAVLFYFFVLFWFIYSTDEISTEHIVCKECSEIFVDRSKLNRHLRSQHSSEKPRFPCTECPSKYSRKYDFDKHYKQHHDGNNKKPVAAHANTSACVLLDHENSDDAQFPSDLEQERYFSPESEENFSRSITAYGPAASHTPTLSSLNSSSLYPRKRRANHDVTAEENCIPAVIEKDDEMMSWCSVLAISLKKMPPADQIEMKMAISNIAGQKELEILKRNEEKSAPRAEATVKIEL